MTLQKNHPEVVFDLTKESRIMKLRGKEDAVTSAKKDVLNFEVKMEKIEIPSREVAIIVGKSGRTINRLVSEFDVSIQVADKRDSKSGSDTASISVSGVGKKVEIAMKEIKDILFNNEDMEVSILVSAMTRNKLLSDSGTLIKQLQKDVNEACQPGNSFVRFEELAKEQERESTSILIVKSPRVHIDEAERIVKERIASYDSNLINMQIDIDLIPVVIGPKGATIKSLRSIGGSGANIEIDKFSGVVKLMADEETQRDAMKKAIDDLISENQILRVPMDSGMFPDLFGKRGKAVKSKIQKGGVFIKIDDSDDAILLRGSIEKVRLNFTLSSGMISNAILIFFLDDLGKFLAR